MSAMERDTTSEGQEMVNGAGGGGHITSNDQGSGPVAMLSACAAGVFFADPNVLDDEERLLAQFGERVREYVRKEQQQQALPPPPPPSSSSSSSSSSETSAGRGSTGTAREEVQAAATAAATHAATQERFAAALPFTTSRRMMLRFLIKAKHQLEAAYSEWTAYMQWRKQRGVDVVTSRVLASMSNANTNSSSGGRGAGGGMAGALGSSFEQQQEQHFLDELALLRLVEWRGRDKEGRRVCVITARHLRQDAVSVSIKAFQLLLIQVAEQAVLFADQDEKEEGEEEAARGGGGGGGGEKRKNCARGVSVVYDRRGLLFEHINPMLYQHCRGIFFDLRRFYADVVSCLYVCHMNVFFWSVYIALIKPALWLVSSGHKLVCVESEQELHALGLRTAAAAETNTEAAGVEGSGRGGEGGEGEASHCGIANASAESTSILFPIDFDAFAIDEATRGAGEEGKE